MTEADTDPKRRRIHPRPKQKKGRQNPKKSTQPRSRKKVSDIDDIPDNSENSIIPIDPINLDNQKDEKQICDENQIQEFLIQNSIVFNPADISGTFRLVKKNLPCAKQRLKLEDITNVVSFLGGSRSILQSAIDMYKPNLF